MHHVCKQNLKMNLYLPTLLSKTIKVNWSNLRSLEISQIFVAFSEYMNFKKFQNEDYFQRKLDEFDEQKAIIFVLSLHIHKS